VSEERYQQVNEKDEKQTGEKQTDEKQDDEKDEKSWDEKWRRDPLSAAVWALILIWAGVVLLAANLGFLSGDFSLSGWSIFFLGAGLLLLAEVAIRLLVPSYRQPVTLTLILSIVFFGIGLGGLIPWYLLWPLILIGIGVYALFRGLGHRRE
jgi:hypothetical protein